MITGDVVLHAAQRFNIASIANTAMVPEDLCQTTDSGVRDLLP